MQPPFPFFLPLGEISVPAAMYRNMRVRIMKKTLLLFILAGLLLVLAGASQATAAWSQPTSASDGFNRQTENPTQADSYSGGLLGAILLGEPFKGITIPDILALLGLGLIGYRLFRMTRDNQDNDGPDRSMSDDDSARGPGGDSEAYRRARQYWDYMNGKKDPPSQPTKMPPPVPGTHSGPEKKGKFDTDDFLKGAKLVYGRIHDSVRSKDYDDLATFTTPDMLERIKNKPGTLAKNGMIMFVDAELLDVTDIAGETSATVRFKALVQYADKGTSEDVSEVWHFRKKSDDLNDTWRLQDTEHFQ